MKKRLLLLSMVSIVALTGCDVSQLKDKDGNQIIVKLGDSMSYTANELFDHYSDTSAGTSQYFNAVYDVLIRAAQDKTTAIEQEVARRIDDFHQDAEDAASENNTSVRTELSKALEAKGVESIDELEQIYYLEEKKTTFENDYYDDNVEGDLLEDYINYYAPYHMRHILVKTSSGDSLYNSTITKDDAINLSEVVRRLASGTESFGTIAQTTAENGDSGSAAIYGDVGVMSTSTEFVSEFKYSVYQYDALWNTAAKTNVNAYNARQKDAKNTRRIGNGTDLIPVTTEEKTYLKESLNRIPYEKFVDLKKCAAITSDNLNDVNKNGKEEYYPRNIIFNNYMNDHALGVITRGTNADVQGESARFANLSEFGCVEGNKADDILVDEAGRPILVSRAGTGSGDGGYQGIHFMIIQKSPFIGDEASLKSYWSTKTYSTNEDVSGINSYITFIDSSRSEYIERANTLKGYIKGFDKHMNFVLFEEALAKAEDKYGKVTFAEGIGEAIAAYMKSSRANSAYSVKETYEKSWDSYLKLLTLQDEVAHLKVAESEIKTLYPNLQVSGKGA